MKKNFEILAPGGDVDAIKAAILAGADAVYCGLDKFNARNRATNISFDELNGIIHLAHKHRCKVYLTLNILILQSEIPYFVSVLNQLVNTNIDGVIVQDWGVFYLLSTFFPALDIHASTQVNTHNTGQVRFLKRLNAGRVNLARELTVHEINTLTSACHENDMETEVFVHGSYCLSFSGLCYISSVFSGRSGNRGRCSQPCRDRFPVTPAGRQYPLNLKDNSAFSNISDLARAGVDALKIEGRIKQCDYVYTVVRFWKQRLESLNDPDSPPADNQTLYTVFNRDFTNGYLTGRRNRDMFIDSPRDYSVDHLSDIHDYETDRERLEGKNRFLEEKEQILADVKHRIRSLSIEQTPISLVVSGSSGQPLTISLTTPDRSFRESSSTPLVSSDPSVKSLLHLNGQELAKRLDFLNHTEYRITSLDTGGLEPGLALSFSTFTALKNRLFYRLNNSKERVHPISVPKLKRRANISVKPSLAVLISSPGDADLCRGTDSEFYMQLPNGFNHGSSRWIDFFSRNPHIVPWFPPVLIGDHYDAAVSFLQKIRPKRIVTNNTGIAHEAFINHIPWIAGPYLNCINSFSLLCLKEKFNAHGAFISNEIGKKQIRGIQAPDDFKLYYSIFHPIMLLGSRQCLFRQVSGCSKDLMDADCLARCQKSDTLTHDPYGPFFIEKTSNNYSKLYHPVRYLNTDVIGDFAELFNGFLIDLRDIRSNTRIETDKAGIIRCFENLLAGHPESETGLRRLIHPTTNQQYQRKI